MFQAELITRFTNHLKEVLQKALSFALQQGRGTLESGDLLVGLLQERGCIGGEILLKSGVTREQAEQYFKGTTVKLSPDQPSSLTLDLSQDVKHVLEKSVLTAHFHEHKYIGTEHLLFALLDLPIESLSSFFRTNKVNPILLRGQVVNILKSTSRFPDVAKRMDQEHDQEETTTEEGEGGTHRSKEKKPKALEVFARELSETKLAETLDPVIGRDVEIDRVTEILCRRTKNNPILLGEPGVGKTAIAEGLAKRLATGQVPDSLKGKRLFAIDLALLVAGTMYRGEFEARLKQLIDEAKEDPNVILFIDEIHTIVGAGSTSGSLDAANMLKPALARGEVRCIGATTWAEYKKFIEPDAALERRYQPVDVPEPTREMTRMILEGLKTRYEQHHKIEYQTEALDAAVRLAERYLTDRFFPDKAIDLLDEAAAHVNNRRKEGKKTGSKKVGKAAKPLTIVKASDIAAVVARLSRVPLSSILLAEREALRGLAERLNIAILGQEQAVQAVAETVQRARLGLSDPRRPKASFLFVGPSGVGKTELARSLAKELFGKEEALLRLDMSEFSEAHTVSKLLGSPAGYVGYREQNRLTDTLRKRPNSVVLLDEFEKAHPDVQHLLLQILEEGQLTDGTGRTISLRNAYVVVTGNVGADQLQRGSLGFGSDSALVNFEARVQDQLKERFRPELLNRFDRVVVFNPLSKDSVEALIRRETQTILERAEESHNMSYRVSQEVFKWLTGKANIKEEGGRAARRVVEKDILPLIASALLKPGSKKGWHIRVKEGRPHISNK
ncbi:ATP-dependent Clp protease ATP-binding subunit [Patescibacteria group bacterium]|nr:ATP-dependent Clp protease ATP-binding subunit [Patescibacteria group bacterium]